MKKYSISIRGHRTSYSLEHEFQNELERLALESGVPISKLIATIDSKREETTNLSSALRLFILQQLKAGNRS